MIKDTLLALKNASHFVFFLRKQALIEMDVSRRSVYLSLTVAAAFSLCCSLLDQYFQLDPDYPSPSDLRGWLSLAAFELFCFVTGIAILAICTHLLGFQRHLTKLIVTGNWVGIILQAILAFIVLIPLPLLFEWGDTLAAVNTILFGCVAFLVPILFIDLYRVIIVTNERVRWCLLLWVCQSFGFLPVYFIGPSIL